MFQNLDRLDSLARMGKLGPINSVEYIPKDHPDYVSRYNYRTKAAPKIHEPSFRLIIDINLKKLWKWIISNKSLVKFSLGVLWILTKIFG